MSLTETSGRFTTLPDEHTLAETVVALEEHGFSVEVVDDLDAARQAVLARIPHGASVMTNTSMTLTEAGIAYASNKESAAIHTDHVRILPVNGAERSGGSSWQSLTRGTGSIEADYLNGEIVLMARERGIPVPVNEVLQRLANQAARDRRAPGSATPDEVLALAALPADAG